MKSNNIKTVLVTLLLLSCGSGVTQAEPPKVLKRFVGPWVTNEGRSLDGIMTCDVVKATPRTDGKGYDWKGRFYGVWKGVHFDYTVTWSGPSDNMKGKYTVDGAPYDWVGSFDTREGKPLRFTGAFKSFRYGGWFRLNEIELK